LLLGLSLLTANSPAFAGCPQPETTKQHSISRIGSRGAFGGFSAHLSIAEKDQSWEGRVVMDASGCVFVEHLPETHRALVENLLRMNARRLGSSALNTRAGKPALVVNSSGSWDKREEDRFAAPFQAVHWQSVGEIEFPMSSHSSMSSQRSSGQPHVSRLRVSHIVLFPLQRQLNVLEHD